MIISVALATKINHLDTPSSDLEQGLSCPAQFHSILELVLLFWDRDKLINSASMAFLQASEFSSGVEAVPETLQSCRSPLTGALGLVTGAKWFWNYLPLNPPARRVAYCTPGLLDFPGLARGDPRLGHDLLNNLRGMNCMWCMHG